MTKPDSFTLRRLTKFVDEFRRARAQLPTLRDLEEAGFPRESVEGGVKAGKLVTLYVTLTTGAIVKGYKTKD